MTKFFHSNRTRRKTILISRVRFGREADKQTRPKRKRKFDDIIERQLGLIVGPFKPSNPSAGREYIRKGCAEKTKASMANHWDRDAKKNSATK